MKIRIISDIHLEFFENDDFELDITEDESNTILILAGDICVAAKANRFKYFFKNVSERFHTVLYVFGNHEFYGSSIKSTPEKIEDILEDFTNIIVLENSTFRIDDIVFVGATLWTDFDDNDPTCVFDSKRFMNDFKRIRHGPSSEPWRWRFSPENAYVIHKESKEFIFNTLANGSDSKKFVVITHHAPSSLSVAKQFKGEILNGAYFTELSNEILDNQPALWIHGHTHFSFDYMLDNTRVICNPYGYKNLDYNKEFNQNMIIDI